MSPLADQGYGEAFAVSALLQILDVRDALDHDRFVSVPMGNQHPVSSKEFPLSVSQSISLESRRKLERQGSGIGLLSPVGSEDEGFADYESDYDFTYSEIERVCGNAA